jgi:hypothetical protein
LKIIFLDVDGVLNIVSGINGFKDSTYYRTGKHMEKDIIENFNIFLEKNINIKIVISSSWRSDMKDLKENLELSGFKFWERVIGNTPINSKYRGEQILEFINNNKFNISKYLVIDDCMGDIHGEEIQYQFIKKELCLKTNPNYGIDKECLLYMNEFFNKN